MKIALKIDVDTYRGLDVGAPRLAEFLRAQKIPASFFVSLGPDNSGWAARRLFRHRGFAKKMRRTGAVSLYGVRTVCSGTLLPARPIGTSFTGRLRAWADAGFEVSPHGYDHIRWHDRAARWQEPAARAELEKAARLYRSIFGKDPRSFAAPGWQAGPGVWRAMEKMNLLYHSDSRGEAPYFPDLGGEILQTPEIPTTLPTWDEMLAWDGVSPEDLAQKTWELLRADVLNVWTVHAEVEGSAYFPQFQAFARRVQEAGGRWIFLPAFAESLRQNPGGVPAQTIFQGELAGRAGTVTRQGRPAGA